MSKGDWNPDRDALQFWLRYFGYPLGTYDYDPKRGWVCKKFSMEDKRER